MASLISIRRQIGQPSGIGQFAVDKARKLGLKAFLPLVSDTRDYSPSNATVTNTSVTPSLSRLGRGYSFNGSSSYLNLGDLFYSDTLTICVTFVPSIVDANPRSLVVKRNKNSVAQSDNEYLLVYSNSGIAFVTWNSAGAAIVNFTAPIIPVVGNAYTVVVMYEGNGGGCRIFVNGAMSATTAISGTIKNTANTLELGATSSNNANRWFSGHLSGFFIGPLLDIDAASVSANPWQIFASQRRSIYFDLGVGGGTGVDLSGNAQSTATGSGSIAVDLAMTGAAIAAVTNTGILNQSVDLSGAAASVTIANGVATITTTLSGDAFTQLFADGTLAQLQSFAGNASLQASGTGALGQQTELSGNVNAQATSAGSVNMTLTLTGDSIMQAIGAANLDAGIPDGLSGNAAGQASGDGNIAMTTAMQGAAGTTLTGAGVLAGNIPLSGTAPATVIGAGGIESTQSLSGAAVAVLNGSGDLQIGYGGLSGNALIEAVGGGAITLSVSMSANALAQAVGMATLVVQGVNALPIVGHYALRRLTPVYKMQTKTPRYDLRSLSSAQ